MTWHLFSEVVLLMVSTGILVCYIVEERVGWAVLWTVATIFWLIALCGGINLAVQRAGR